MTETNLPVRAVTLFSSGVAFVLHEGEVPEGAAETPLTFRTPQVKDVLKSLVLLDEGGSVQPAVYPSQDPIERTLASFAVNVSGNVTQGTLLRQLRGVPLKVEVEGRRYPYRAANRGGDSQEIRGAHYPDHDGHGGSKAGALSHGASA
ncbi:MAG: hypothetical protein QM758_02285 [Armatimonas sp.]